MPTTHPTFLNHKPQIKQVIILHFLQSSFQLRYPWVDNSAYLFCPEKITNNVRTVFTVTLLPVYSQCNPHSEQFLKIQPNNKISTQINSAALP